MRKKRLKCIHITDPEAPQLSVLHRDLIVPLFSDVNDVDTVSSMRHYMQVAPTLSKQCLAYSVIMMTDNDDNVVGATIFGVFSPGPYSFIKGEYTVVAPEVRGHGTVELLMKERRRVAGCLCSSLGAEEPGFTVIQVSTGGSRQNGRLRRMWRQRSFRRLQLPFVQLPLREGLEPITTFDLYLQPLNSEFMSRTSITANEAVAVIDACNTFRESDAPLSSDPYYCDMIRTIQQNRGVRIE